MGETETARTLSTGLPRSACREPLPEEPEAAEPEPQPEASAEVEYFREAVKMLPRNAAKRNV